MGGEDPSIPLQVTCRGHPRPSPTWDSEGRKAMLISVRVLMTLAARDFTSSLNRASGQAAGGGSRAQGKVATLPWSCALPQASLPPCFLVHVSVAASSPFLGLHDAFATEGCDALPLGAGSPNPTLGMQKPDHELLPFHLPVPSVPCGYSQSVKKT